MAAPSYTYSLSNGATADASQVMQNYNDILNGVTDGTKDLTINALTCNGAASFKGTVTLGDASSDDVTFTGSLASSIPIKTTNAFDIGSASLGLRAAYFGANSQTAKIVGNGSMAGAVVVTLPVSTDTVVGLATTDTLTNKTLTSPKLNEAVAVTTTATKLNYLTSAGGTTGTASTNIVFSTSPTLVTPVLGVATATSLAMNSTGDSNLGTIDTVTLAAYYSGHFTATFDGVGFAATQTITVLYTKIGRLVTMEFPTKSAATSTGPATAFIATTATIPSILVPQGIIEMPCISTNNGTLGTGEVYINTSGIIRFYRSTDGTTTFTNTSTQIIGWDRTSISYIVAS